MELRRQIVTRYIMPLREGGSLPALAEADDGIKYVVKMRGAGHGTKALIAELIGGEVARALGLRVPEIVFLDIPEEFGITEPDQEVQDLLKASRGLNLGLHFLSSALTLDPYANPVDELTASKIVWLDAFLTNVDRTRLNTNMLQWYTNEAWLIDHGASLYFQHSGTNPEEAALTTFHYIKNHLFLRRATRLDEVDAEFSKRLTPEIIDEIVDLIPDEWLDSNSTASFEDQRNVYRTFLKVRLANTKIFTDYAKQARALI